MKKLNTKLVCRKCRNSANFKCDDDGVLYNVWCNKCQISVRGPRVVQMYHSEVAYLEFKKFGQSARKAMGENTTVVSTFEEPTKPVWEFSLVELQMD